MHYNFTIVLSTVDGCDLLQLSDGYSVSQILNLFTGFWQHLTISQVISRDSLYLWVRGYAREYLSRN